MLRPNISLFFLSLVFGCSLTPSATLTRTPPDSTSIQAAAPMANRPNAVVNIELATNGKKVDPPPEIVERVERALAATGIFQQLLSATSAPGTDLGNSVRVRISLLNLVSIHVSSILIAPNTTFSQDMNMGVIRGAISRTYTARALVTISPGVLPIYTAAFKESFNQLTEANLNSVMNQLVRDAALFRSPTP